MHSQPLGFKSVIWPSVPCGRVTRGNILVPGFLGELLFLPQKQQFLWEQHLSYYNIPKKMVIKIIIEDILYLIHTTDSQHSFFGINTLFIRNFLLRSFTNVRNQNFDNSFHQIKENKHVCFHIRSHEDLPRNI